MNVTATAVTNDSIVILILLDMFIHVLPSKKMHAIFHFILTYEINGFLATFVSCTGIPCLSDGLGAGAVVKKWK